MCNVHLFQVLGNVIKQYIPIIERISRKCFDLVVDIMYIISIIKRFNTESKTRTGQCYSCYALQACPTSCSSARPSGNLILNVKKKENNLLICLQKKGA